VRKFLQVGLFASALAPALIVLACKNFYQVGPTLEAFCWFIAGTVACMLPLLIIAAASKKCEVMPASVKKVEQLDWPLVVAIGTYFVPLLRVDFSALAVVLLLAVIVLSAVDAIPFHPVLRAFKYRLYKAEVGGNVYVVLISRRNIRDASSVKNIRELTPGFIMEDV